MDDLPVGTNVLTARYDGVGGGPCVSDTIELQVRDTIECPSNARGSGSLGDQGQAR